jgi:hypothetical protein
MAKTESPDSRTDDFLDKPGKVRRERRRLFKEVKVDPKYRPRIVKPVKLKKRRQKNVTKDYMEGKLDDV